MRIFDKIYSLILDYDAYHQRYNIGEFYIVAC